MPDTATVTVGLDVHRASVRLAALRADELLDECTLPNDPVAVERSLARWPQVLCCYEAGPTGFGLYRHLVERGIDCRVVAPGLVPNLPGERIKTDARDARKLARLLAGGLLEPIWVPSPELEGARDLVRAREDARLDRMRDRHRLSKFCLRHGRPLPGASWGAAAANGSPINASRSSLSSAPSTTTCTQSTSSTAASKRSTPRSEKERRTGPGRRWSRGCAACEESTP